MWYMIDAQGKNGSQGTWKEVSVQKIEVGHSCFGCLSVYPDAFRTQIIKILAKAESQHIIRKPIAKL